MEILKQSSSTRENLGLLAVLEAIEGGEETTQRQIAQVTGLNLKKVNYTLKKLLEKGHIKFQRVRDNPDKRAYLYLLTPSGLKAKSRLTYRFLKFTLEFYTRVEQKLDQCLDEMARFGVRQVLLYGASDVVRVLHGFEQRSLEVVGVVGDPDSASFNGFPVISADLIPETMWDGILITALDGLDQIDQELERLGVDPNKVWRLS